MALPLSIIIVNYRSANLVVESIKTIFQYNKHFNFEIIVVDNASNDESEAIISHAFPQVRFIQMGYNAGFARANNTGMKAAQGENYLLLNPDTLSIDNSIEKCFEKLTASDFIAAGVQLLDREQKPQISGSFFVKGGLNHLLPIPYWGTIIRWIGYTAKAKVPNVQQAASIERVHWISGAFLMVKKTAVEKAGMMDEDFFLYGEEVEWCSRLNKVGQLVLFGDCMMIHLEGAAINKSQNINERGYYNLYDRKGLQLMVSNHLRVRKQYGAIWFLVLLLNYTFGVFVFFFAGFLHHLFLLQNPFKQLGKVAAFAKNVIRLWGLTPKIIQHKPYFYKMFGS